MERHHFRGSTMPPDPHLATAQPSALARIMGDLEAAGVRPTPLGILARATDIGLSDTEIGTIVDELAAQRGFDEVAA